MFVNSAKKHRPDRPEEDFDSLFFDFVVELAGAGCGNDPESKRSERDDREEHLRAEHESAGSKLDTFRRSFFIFCFFPLLFYGCCDLEN